MFLIVMALFCEAKCLIENFKLKKKKDKPFTIFANDDLQLIISGIGSINAASATSYLISKNENTEVEGILNIGLTGNAKLKIKTPILIDKVKASFSNKIFHPTILFPPPCLTNSLYTCNKLQPMTSSDCYDMEGFGFFSAATKNLKLELIHSLKIISDNNMNDFKKMTKEYIVNIVESQLDLIKILKDKIKKIYIKFKEFKGKNMDLESLTKNICFNSNQKYHLKEILEKIDSLNSKINKENLKNFKSATDVLKYLKEKKKKTPYIF